MSVSPDRPVLIYDGDCSFCQRWVDRFKQWERGDEVQLLTAQDPLAQELSGRSLDQLLDAMCLVLPDGRTLTGAEAARALAPRLRWGTPLRVLFAIPGAMWLARRAYRLVADNRHRLGCNGEHCGFPVDSAGRRQ